MNHPPVIVSITPSLVQNDSRSLKQATTLGRVGYRSIVLEMGKSDLSQFNKSFELISISPLKSSVPTQQPIPVSDPTNAQERSLSTSRLKTLFGNIIDMSRFIGHLVLYAVRDIVMVVLKSPRAKLYYLHAPYHFPAVYILSRLYGVPYIYDAHDFYSDMIPSYMLSSYELTFRQPFYNKIERLCIKHAAAVVTVSSGLADLLHQTFHCQSIVIRNVHDLRIDGVMAHDVKEHLGLNNGCLLLIVVGQAKQGRAMQSAIDALSNLPDNVHLVFLGRGYDGLLRNIEDTSIATRVHAVSPVKPYEVVPYIRSADIALLLYYALTVDYEISLPNGLFQSIAAGLPLLYPELTEIRRIAEAYQLGLPIDPQSPTSIHNAVKELLENPTRFDTYRQNAQAAAKTLNWEHEEELLIKLVREYVK